MEYAGNGQLFDYIVKHKKIKEHQACKLFQQLISGIEYLHRLNIVHRDLKPENLLIDYNMGLRIVDFGLSNTYKKDQLLKTACGSPCYAAPQMIKGNKYIGLDVDIWSSGVILFAMICGYLPFEDPNTSKLYNKILNGQYQIPKFVSSDAKDLISKILEINPDKRYSISDIRKHKWWHLNNESKESEGLIVGYNRIPVDTQILARLIPLGFKIDYAQKCIQANRHNSVTTSYYLLLKKHLKEGGTSIADLGSQNFDKSLIEPIRKKDKSTIQLLAESFPAKDFLSIDKEDDKKQKVFNSFVFPKGKLASTGQSAIKDIETSKNKQNQQFLVDKNQIKINKKQNIKSFRTSNQNLENKRIPYNSLKQQDKSNQQIIRKKYRQNYGASLVSRSNDKRRDISKKTNKKINIDRSSSKPSSRKKEFSFSRQKSRDYQDHKKYIIADQRIGAYDIAKSKNKRQKDEYLNVSIGGGRNYQYKRRRLYGR